jgi:BolA family transcriptional regulator, general stress-responsive regulator
VTSIFLPIICVAVLVEGFADPYHMGMTNGPIQTEMEALLTAAFAPTHLAVINDSASHHGHAGDDGSGESHFTVEIESAAFAGVNRVMRQRMVNKALGDLPGQRVHALAIKATVAGE